MKKLSYYYITDERNTLTLPLNSENCFMIGKPSFCFHIHNHSALEIIVVKKGPLFFKTDEHEYIAKSGDVLLFNPFVPHQCEWLYEDIGEYIYLTINLEGLLNFNNSAISVNYRELQEGSAGFKEYYMQSEPLTSEIAKIVEIINHSYSEKTVPSELKTLSEVYKLLSVLNENFFELYPNKNNYNRNISFLRNITLFLSENYMKDISTCDAARYINLSQPQFCRVFRNHFGCNFMKHLCQYRVIQAANLFKNSELSVTDIALEVGFSDYCYFSRSFKKYIGLSPAKYFGKWK